MREPAAVPRTAALTQLRAELSRLIVPEDAESIWQCEPALLTAYKDGEFSALLNEELRGLLADLRHRTPITTPLFRGDGFVLNVIGLKPLELPSAVDLFPSPRHKLYLNLGHSPITFLRYERIGGEMEVFDDRSRLVRRGKFILSPGGLLRAVAGLDLFTADVSPSRGALATLLGPMKYETVTVYDGDTLQPIRMHASRPTIPRVQCALTLLKEMGVAPTGDIVDAVLSLLSNPSHVVRWSAAKTLSSFSPELRERALSQLTEDPHPHIRNAVTRSRNKVSNGN